MSRDRLDQAPVEGNEGERLEAHHLARAAVDGHGRRRQHEIFQPDAVLALAVKPGLVGQDHAGLELDAAEARQALRRLMHREIAADPMPGAVIEIEPGRPQRPAREGVEVLAARPLGEPRRGDGDVALEHESVMAAHLGRGRADGDGARDVGGAVGILAAGIDEIERVAGEAERGRAHRPVMHDGAVRPHAGDGVEADVLELARLAAQLLELHRRGNLVDAARRHRCRRANSRSGRARRRRADAPRARPRSRSRS